MNFLICMSMVPFKNYVKIICMLNRILKPKYRVYIVYVLFPFYSILFFIFF